MSLQKRYLKSKPVCKVTFRLTPKEAKKSQKVYLVGDFNNWENSACPMQRLKSGVFKAVLNLKLGQEYQFRYLLEGEKWENDWNADKYVPSGIGDCENSVVVIKDKES